MGKGGQLAIAVVSVLAALAWVVSSSEGTFVYFHSVSEMMAATSEATPDRDLRVHGFVVEGSIDKNLNEALIRFAIQDTPMQPGEATPATSEPELTLSVVYEGIDVPDLFRDGAEVVVEGEMVADTFKATRIMAKCPSKYENKPEGPAQVADIGTDG